MVKHHMDIRRVFEFTKAFVQVEKDRSINKNCPKLDNT